MRCRKERKWHAEHKKFRHKICQNYLKTPHKNTQKTNSQSSLKTNYFSILKGTQEDPKSRYRSGQVLGTTPFQSWTTTAPFQSWKRTTKLQKKIAVFLKPVPSQPWNGRNFYVFQLWNGRFFVPKTCPLLYFYIFKYF